MSYKISIKMYTNYIQIIYFLIYKDSIKFKEKIENKVDVNLRKEKNCVKPRKEWGMKSKNTKQKLGIDYPKTSLGNKNYIHPRTKFTHKFKNKGVQKHS